MCEKRTATKTPNQYKNQQDYVVRKIRFMLCDHYSIYCCHFVYVLQLLSIYVHFLACMNTERKSTCEVAKSEWFHMKNYQETKVRRIGFIHFRLNCHCQYDSSKSTYLEFMAVWITKLLLFFSSLYVLPLSASYSTILLSLDKILLYTP